VVLAEDGGNAGADISDEDRKDSDEDAVAVSSKVCQGLPSGNTVSQSLEPCQTP
jgi:hypothetical protein